jgi:putative heme iron utilization protein
VNSQVHNVFHVSQLKEYRADYTPVFSELPKVPALDVTNTEPETILDHRMMKKGNASVIQVLIKWTNLPEDAATWEDWDTLKTSFPSVLTWGQVSSSPGGNVTHLVRAP